MTSARVDRPSPRRESPPSAAQLESTLLRRIIAAASGRLDLSDMVQRLATLATEVTASDVCFVHVIDHARARLVLRGATPPFDVHAGQIELALGEGVAGWVAIHAEPVVVEDKWTDARYKYIPELRGQDYTSLASVPMISRAGQVVGVLNVHSRSIHHFRNVDVGILADVANLMADAVESARLHAQLAQRESDLESFAEHTLELQEAERQRVAAEIHDGIGQRIVGLSYFLSAITEIQPQVPDRVLELVASAKRLASDALDEARAAINGLRPPLLDDFGLGVCLRGLGAGLPGHIDREVDVDDPQHLDAHVETAIYRMAQEILQNVLKHADAQRVSLRLTCDDTHVILRISDDGRGFDPDTLGSSSRQHSFGIAGLRARAALIGADLTIDSAPWRGTTVSVAVPLAAG